MTDYAFVDESMDVVFQLLHLDNLSEIADWKALPPIELAVLSWHLGSFYWRHCGEAILCFDVADAPRGAIA